MASIGYPFGAYWLEEMGIDQKNVVRFTVCVAAEEVLTVRLERLTADGTTTTETHQPDTIGRLGIPIGV